MYWKCTKEEQAVDLLFCLFLIGRVTLFLESRCDNAPIQLIRKMSIDQKDERVFLSSIIKQNCVFLTLSLGFDTDFSMSLQPNVLFS